MFFPAAYLPASPSAFFRDVFQRARKLSDSAFTHERDRESHRGPNRMQQDETAKERV